LFDTGSLSAVRKLFAFIVIVGVVFVGFAVLGGQLPEGNFLHDATEPLRAVGRNMADGFGGGYGGVAP